MFNGPQKSQASDQDLIKYDVLQLVRSLLGSTSVCCETNHDNAVIRALKDYDALLIWLVNNYIDMAKWKDDWRFSAKEIGTKADATLDYVTKMIETFKEVDPNA